jgi:hypothetical protein
MLIWAMFDCRYKLDQIGVRWHKLEGSEEKKRVMNHNPGDWMKLQATKFPSVDYFVGRELQNSNQEGSSQLDGDPSDWIINCSNSSRNSRLQILKNPVDWMMIQAIGLINRNQAESPRAF